MNKLSIIIPVYNVEPYIRKCLDSVINQTYKNLEIICIDDGSTDSSGEICEEYAKKDLRIKVFHKTNGGYPSALNLGLNNFTGDYVTFVDPDDWIELDYYQTAYNLAKHKKADIICFGFYKDTDEKCTLMRNSLPIDRGNLNREQILKYTFMRDIYNSFGAYLWNKIFDSIFFRTIENNGYQLRLSEDMKVGCDVLLFTKCVLKVKNAIYCENAYYHYFQRETSLFHSKDIEKRRGSLKAYKKVIELLEQNKISKCVSIWVKRFYTYHASLLAELALENNDIKNFLLMQNKMRRYLVEYIETNKEYPERLRRINKLLNLKIDNIKDNDIKIN